MCSNECRGDVCYDDEHDQVPEDSLWQAGQKFVKELEDDGYEATLTHSEKGWVEVRVSKK